MRYLGMHKHDHQYWLDLMSQSTYSDSPIDSYNDGPLVDELETRVAALLGKPDALFFNKGTTCQLAALKVHCDNNNNRSVMLHPQSHIAFDEHNAYHELMGLEGILVGHADQPITLQDVQAAKQDAAVLVVELPLRRAGFKLPEWQELLKLRHWCDEKGVVFHMDGARLWECANHYHHSWASIAGLFDSVYISLYKGLGGIGGALLAGEAHFLTQCQLWRDRLGSNKWTAFPALITALQGLDNNLKLISSWVIRAKEIAAALKSVDGLIITPAQTNGFQIRVQGNRYQLNNRLISVGKQMDISPCKPFAPVNNSRLLFTEIQVGAQHGKIRTHELVQFFQQIIQSR